MNDQMLLDKMSQMIRLGFVNARQPEKMRVKVTLPDTPGQPLVTDWLPVLCPRACADLQFDLPDIGDQVLCLFLAYGLEQGFVIGSMYGRQSPPVQSGDKWHRTFSDGAKLEYDRASHSLSADIPGTVTIKCAQSITLEAPIIYVRGTLQHTAQDGSPGKSVFSGGMEVMNGGINAMDGDIVASGVSLASHTTEGVEPGDGQSRHPTGGSNESPGTLAMTVPAYGSWHYLIWLNAHLESLKKKVDASGNKADEIIYCIPKIANARAEKEKINEADRQGWIYLYEMSRRWLAGPVNTNAFANKFIFHVDLEWILKYRRARLAYEAIKDNWFTKNAKNRLAKILFEHEMLGKDSTIFDFTQPVFENNSYQGWYNTYYQSEFVRAQITWPPDGLMACMASFRFRLYARGWAEPSPKGHRIYIQAYALYATDSFNFDNFDDYGYWQCSPPDIYNPYYPDPPATAIKIKNDNFRKFRELGNGEDFLVLLDPEIVENKLGLSYETEL